MVVFGDANRSILDRCHACIESVTLTFRDIRTASTRAPESLNNNKDFNIHLRTIVRGLVSTQLKESEIEFRDPVLKSAIAARSRLHPANSKTVKISLGTLQLSLYPRQEDQGLPKRLVNIVIETSSGQTRNNR